MFTETIQYSFNAAIQYYKNKENSLPITSTNNNVKCLDFDLDTIVFKSVPKSPVHLAEVNPYNKTLLEVMEMV